MSNQAVTWAFRQHLQSPAERIVLVVLADAANLDGEINIDTDDLAERACMPESAGREVVSRLESLGLLTVHHDGKGHSRHGVILHMNVERINV